MRRVNDVRGFEAGFDPEEEITLPEDCLMSEDEYWDGVYTVEQLKWEEMRHRFPEEV